MNETVNGFSLKKKGICFMKKIFRSPVTWVGVVACTIILFLYFCGFRITYAPEMENSWEAISAFAGWFGAIASAIAIFVAIRVPKKIAERQDSIALFEKRYSAFDAFVFLTSVAERFDKDDYKESDIKPFMDEVVEVFKTFADGNGFSWDNKDSCAVFRRQIIEAGKIRFLFNLTEMKAVSEFLDAFNFFIRDVFNGKFCSIQKVINTYKIIENEKIGEKLALQVKTQNRNV